MIVPMVACRERAAERVREAVSERAPLGLARVAALPWRGRLAVWIGLIAAAAVSRCARGPLPAVPAYRVQEVRVGGAAGKTHLTVAMPGQLLWVGSGLVVPYAGGAEVRAQRKGVRLLVGGKTVGLDLTGLDADEALHEVRRRPWARLIRWLDLPGLSREVMSVLEALRSERISLVLGLALTARRGLDLRRLGPLCQRIAALRVEGEVRRNGLRWLRRCRHLRALVVRGALSARQISELGTLGRLHHLDLAGALRPFGQGSVGLAPLGKLRALVSLDLSANGLVDRDLDPLAGLRRLHWLRLAENPLEVIGLGWLSRVKRLAYLDVSATRITPKGLARLAGLGALRWLRLDQTRIRPRARRVFSRARPKVHLILGGVAPEVALGPLVALGPAPRPLPPRRPPRRAAARPAPVMGPLPKTGVASCDRFLRTFLCLTTTLSKMSPSRVRTYNRQARTLARRIVKMGKAQAVRLCGRMLKQMTRLARSNARYRRCLKP